MLIINIVLMNVIRLLEDCGATAELLPSADRAGPADALLDADLDGVSTRFAVTTKSRAPRPGQVAGMGDLWGRLEHWGAPMLAAPFVSEAAGRALADARWSWADACGNADIRARGLRVNRRVSSAPTLRRPRGLPQGAGSWAVIRMLIADGRVDGATALARRAGVSQPRASQILSHLTEAGYVEREGRSRWRADRAELLDAFIAEYPGPQGETAWYYSLSSPAQTCDHVLAAAASASTRAAVSGDVAADRIAAWRVPTFTTVYVAEPHVLTRLRLTPATGPQDANVEVIVPDDRSVFCEAPTADASLAHPTQVIYDQERLGGTDRSEAGERIKTWLLNH